MQPYLLELELEPEIRGANNGSIVSIKEDGTYLITRYKDAMTETGWRPEVFETKEGQLEPEKLEQIKKALEKDVPPDDPGFTRFGGAQVVKYQKNGETETLTFRGVNPLWEELSGLIPEFEQ